VPWQYVGKEVWVREQGRDVEVRYGAERIALHGQATTRYQVVMQSEHHQGIPLGGPRTGTNPHSAARAGRLRVYHRHVMKFSSTET
jgi:hypothetical protein